MSTASVHLRISFALKRPESGVLSGKEGKPPFLGLRELLVTSDLARLGSTKLHGVSPLACLWFMMLFRSLLGFAANFTTPFDKTLGC